MPASSLYWPPFATSQACATGFKFTLHVMLSRQRYCNNGAIVKSSCCRKEGSYTIDQKLLERNYKSLQRQLHPDRFTRRSEASLKNPNNYILMASHPFSSSLYRIWCPGHWLSRISSLWQNAELCLLFPSHEGRSAVCRQKEVYLKMPLHGWMKPIQFSKTHSRGVSIWWDLVQAAWVLLCHSSNWSGDAHLIR